MKLPPHFVQARRSVSKLRHKAGWHRRRRIHAFCLGMGKSGTHSIDAIFRVHYRSSHEPRSKEVIRQILAHEEGRLGNQEFVEYVRNLDRSLWLEMNASQLNYFLLDALLELFPESKHILLVRDCYSWTDSFMNHQLAWAEEADEEWIALRNFRFSHDDSRYLPEEAILQEHGLYRLDGYFSHWAHFISRVISTVPKDRLLVIRTKDLSNSIGSIADFLDVPKNSLNSEFAHSFKAKAKHHVLADMDPEFVNSRASAHCAQLMQRFFPELRSVDDALATNAGKG